MNKHIKTFFYPKTFTYSYNYPKELVISKIQKILNSSVTYFTSKDMEGSFVNSDTFTINTFSPAVMDGLKCSSTLVGQIVESQKEMTEISTKARPSFMLYLMFFSTILFGVIFLYRFIEAGMLEDLIWALIMTVVGPSLSIGLSNVAIAAIYERYVKYIHKELKVKQ